MSEKNYANIMFIGRTGVGKSSFINYLVGKDICKTGVGKPVTPGFNGYECDNVDGVPLRIFDSKGLEADDFETICKEIKKYILEKCNQDDVKEWIHSIFYCVNLKSNRLEAEEVKLIKDISSDISQNIHIVITHCSEKYETLKANADKMVEKIKEDLSNENIHIYRVNSVDTNTRAFKEEAFGREKILNEIFMLLWSDIAHKFAADYSKKLNSQIIKIAYKMKNKIRVAIKSEMRPGKIIWKAIKDDLDDLEEKLDKYCEDMEEEFNNATSQMEAELEEKIQPLIEFISGYSTSLRYKLETYDIHSDMFDEFDDIDIDSILENSKLAEISREIDNCDFESDDILENLKNLQVIIKGLGAILGIKNLCLRLVDDIFNLINEALPSRERIEESIYHSLMGIIDSNDSEL